MKICRNNIYFSFSESQRGFERFDQSRAVFVADRDAVLDDLHARAQAFDFFVGIDAHDLVVDPNAQITLLLEEIEKRARFCFRRNRNPESDENSIRRPDRLSICPHLALRVLLSLRERIEVRAGRKETDNVISDRLRGFRPDFAATTRAEGARDARPEKFQVIVDLGHGPDGRTRTFDWIRLLDGNGRRDAPDIVDPRFIHAVEELPHVRAEGFDITALALSVNGFEGETRFAAAARAGDDSQFSEWKIDIDAFEIVLARPANLDAAALRWRGDAFFFNNFRTHRRQFQMVSGIANFREKNAISVGEAAGFPWDANSVPYSSFLKTSCELFALLLKFLRHDAAK
jgi:hypothetical protein